MRIGRKMVFYFTRKIKSLNTANWIDSNSNVMANNMEPREFIQTREIKANSYFTDECTPYP